MCKTISFISGKGGSGKTTLALSIASVLSKCGIKTLLIDCDLSTNGATYFYEDRLSTKKNTILSFYDVLFNENSKRTKLVRINEFYDFMPSITQITKKNTKMFSYKNDSSIPVYTDISQKYDVVLFDCQAGYTDILKLILPISDISLIVMEADAISSAAMRSLFLKVGDIVNDKKLYQVFNKASKEEYEIYSKVSGGTVFTNIETVMFDWKIRKAFSVSQIPDMENTSANYGRQIFNICSILLPQDTILDKLNRFKSTLDIHEFQEKENAIKSQINDLKVRYAGKKNKLKRTLITVVMMLMGIVTTALILLTMYFSHTERTVSPLVLSIVVASISVIISYINVFDITREKRDYENELSAYQDELAQISLDKKKIQNLINTQSVKTK